MNMNKTAKGLNMSNRKEEAPPPAEAATEVGIDDAPETIGSILLVGAVVMLVVLVAAFIAGYFS